MHTAAQLKGRVVAPVDMGLVASVILGGGQGTRLFPLTACRCKPAMPFGGKYRLIDVPISNSILSECRKIFVLTQFLSSTLHKHIIETYRFNEFSSGFVDILSAEQTPNSDLWFQGTADAVRQNIEYLKEIPVDYYLILSGDQLYSMDYRDMLRLAIKTEADLVVASLPVPEKDASRLGLLKVNSDGLIVDFVEKPKEKEVLQRMQVPAALLERQGIDQSRNYLGSMGIYLFRRETLFQLLKQDTREDFGKHLIPTKVKKGKAYAYLFDGYWEDVGTVRSFFDTNIALTGASPPFDCSSLFSERYYLPSPKVLSGNIAETILCEGSVIEGADIKNSIIGPRTHVGEGCMVRSSYIMGHEGHFSESEVKIGKNCLIKNAILDKGVCLGDRVQLLNHRQIDNFDGDGIYIRDGIIVVTKGVHLPPYFHL